MTEQVPVKKTALNEANGTLSDASSVSLDREVLETLLNQMNSQRPDHVDDEIDLIELWRGLMRRKWLIIGLTLLTMLAAAVAAFNMTPKYESKVLLTPVSADGGSSGLLAKYGSLASMAGISLPSGKSGVSKVAEAKAILTSYQFLASYIAEHELKPVLFPKRWDKHSGQWLVSEPGMLSKLKTNILGAFQFTDPSLPSTGGGETRLMDGEPSMQQAVEAMRRQISVSEAKDSGMITVKVTWRDPQQAKVWANDLVATVDRLLREKTVKESEEVINYLKAKLPTIQLADIRNMALAMIEEEMKQVTFAKVKPEYVFKVLDPAIVAEKPISPKKGLIVAVGLVLGLMLSVFAALLLNMRSEK